MQYLNACIDEALEDGFLFTKAVRKISIDRGVVLSARDTGMARETLFNKMGE